jgi:hypothetical protein
MTDTKQLLDRAARSAAAPAFDLDDLVRRKGHRARAERIRAGAAGLILALIAIAVGFTALRPEGAPNAAADGAVVLDESLPPATRSPLVAGRGEYYYRAVLLVDDGCHLPVPQDGTCLDATYWWSPSDDSGRVAVDQARGYGIEGGRFGPGAFPDPNGVDVTSFPLDPTELTAYLLDRSAEDGTSPAPLVTPPPEGAPNDGQLWRAITDLLADPHATPDVRAALLDVAAGLKGSSVEANVLDPAGRPAHAIVFGNWGGELEERLFVDPDTHELLGWTTSSEGTVLEMYLVQHAGVADSTEAGPAPDEGSVPLTLLSTEDLVAMLGGNA